MLKEAIEKIVELSGAKTFKVGDKTFSDRTLSEVKPEIEKPSTQGLTSLEAMSSLIRTEAIDLYPAPIYITVPQCDAVECFTRVDTENRYNRNVLYHAKAVDVPGWEPDTKLPFDQASVALQTRFQATDDRDYVLRLLSQLTCGAKVTYNDNGVAMTVVTQKGVALQGAENIRPLVRLKPYRTFQEIDQPESLFLIRVDERGISFIEADGGMWKLEARKTIKAYLVESLSDLIESGNVVVAL